LKAAYSRILDELLLPRTRQTKTLELGPRFLGLNAVRRKTEPTRIPSFLGFVGELVVVDSGLQAAARIGLAHRESTAQDHSLAATARLHRNIQWHRRNNEFTMKFAF
jgi:hypothetical protein